MITAPCTWKSLAASRLRLIFRSPTKAHAPSSKSPARLTTVGKGEKMLLNTRKRFLAGLMVLLACTAFGQSTGQVEFSMRSIDGQTVTSQSLRGEVVVLAFGASWLPLSKAQLQGIRKFADDYSSKGVVVYWVSTESE